ncbi:MAG: c-type cytochrome biogenesis protein CcmI [Alphaproteobacteria bacterium]|nr:MAG: c-type cytochrome biogenesis protein CcmI [Alphaproteobacteria bacterium]
MIFWLAIALVSVAVLGALLWPLLHGVEDGRASDADRRLAVYRDQLAQLARERALGILDADAASALELEIQRHMLRQPLPASTPGPARRAPRALALGLALVLPAASIGLYLLLGMPDYRARAIASQAPDSGAGLTIDDMVARLQARLERTPEDVRGWQMLGRSMQVLGRPGDAVTALERAYALAPEDVGVQAELAEALVQAAGGQVPARAQTLFRAVGEKDAQEPRAPYYLALALAQAGDGAGAIALWRGLEAASPANAPWLPATRARISETAARFGIDPARVAPVALAPMATD